ncbi:glycosyltransferase family 4 protein [Stenoxybacter acetivorans]|uniref:glycosyltransferase family 4 protein n=1 Tax=Stenoxybacter acetivorans TaxID=422441 RepID=UPI0005675B86|nr:glycosyltransferase family 4 protein [Stenoxybacter acetivorans]
MEIHFFIPDVNPLGGRERVVLETARLFIQQGHQVYLTSIESANHDTCTYDIPPNLSIQHLNFGKHTHRRLLKIVYEIKLIFWLLKNIKSDRIYISTDVWSNLAFSVFRLFRKNTIIGCDHGAYGTGGPKVNWLKGIYRHLNALVVLTEEDRNTYQQKNGLNNVCVIPNALPFAAEHLPLPDYAAKKIITLGRFAPIKGYDLLIREIKPVLRQYPDWQLYIVGKGEMQQRLQDLIEAEQLQGQVILQAAVKEVIPEYLSASVYVCSSLKEGFPMTLLEAKSLGLPIVSYDCNHGPRHIIQHEQDGLLIPYRDAQQFAAALNRLLANETLREQLGKAGKHNAAAYTPANIYQKWRQLLEQVDNHGN